LVRTGFKDGQVREYLDTRNAYRFAYRLLAWTLGEAGRDVRHPDYHIIDTGIASVLRGITADAYVVQGLHI
jgi:hypothetical protein